jgi:hypothetical protein
VTPADDAALGAPIDPFRDRQVVHEGYSVLVTRSDGQITDEEEGLFDFDTRILSLYRLTLDGEVPSPLDSASDSNRWLAHLLAPRPGGSAAGPHLPQDAIEIEIERRVGCGMEERLTLRNHGMTGVTTELAIEVDADFADRMAIGGAHPPYCDTTLSWDASGRALTFAYHASRSGRTLDRALRVTVAQADTAPARAARTLSFQIRLSPRGEWRATLGFASLVDGAWRDRLGADAPAIAHRAAGREEWGRTRTRL